MLQQEFGRENAQREFLRLETRTFGAPVGRATIEAEAVVNGRLLMSIKHYEGPVEDQLVKVRLVALGNMLFTKHGTCGKT